MFSIPEITFNLVFFSLIGLLCGLGFLFGENRLKALSYGGILALFILQMSADSMVNDLTSKVNAPIAMAKIGFVAVICAAFFVGAVLHQKKARFKVRAIPLGVITALALTGYSIGLLTEKARETLTTDYNLAAMVYNFRFILLLVLGAWLLIIQFIPDKSDKDDKKK